MSRFLIAVLGLLLIGGCPQPPEETDAKTVRLELTDGSVLRGKIISLKDGVYTIRLASGGAATVRDSSIASILPDGDEAPPPPSSSPPLRFHGSNTLGETLVPRLVESWAQARKSSGLEWKDGTRENERNLRITTPGSSLVPKAVEVAAHGTKTAFEAFVARTTDVGMASRKVKDSDPGVGSNLADFTAQGVENVVGLDGLAIIVHPSRQLGTLSVEEISRIFAGEITNWGQVRSPAGPINLYARDDNSGTYDFFNDEALKPYGKVISSRAKRFESSTDLSAALSADTQGIGFIGLPYVLEAKAVTLEECGLSYPPSPYNIRLEEYPLARRLYLYSPRPLNTPRVDDFLGFARSDEGQKVVDDVGFVGLQVELDRNRTQQSRAGAASRYSQTGSLIEKLDTIFQQAQRLSVTFRFRTSAEDLDTRASDDLGRLAAYLRKSSSISQRVLLLGFADSDGDYDHNLTLSQRRADAVAAGLRAQGVSGFEVHAFGEEAPVLCNESDRGKEKNRRVEVWVHEPVEPRP